MGHSDLEALEVMAERWRRDAQRVALIAADHDDAFVAGLVTNLRLWAKVVDTVVERERGGRK